LPAGEPTPIPYPVLVNPDPDPPVATPKFPVEFELRKNWLILALLGLGGKCEKSLGAKCRNIS
jgi:hypothetical protein